MGFDKEDSLYVHRKEPNGKISVLRTETYFQHDSTENVLISNVEDFMLVNASMFATRKTTSGMTEIKLVQFTGAKFQTAKY